MAAASLPLFDRSASYEVASRVPVLSVPVVCDWLDVFGEVLVGSAGWAWVAAAISIEEMTTARVLLRMIDTLHGMS
jgi:hypothetical protein